MNTKNVDPKKDAANVMSYLRYLRTDPVAMANLRCALNPNQLSRAWPLLARIGGIGRPVYETVAGLYAYHPEETSKGNFGTTCRSLMEYISVDGRFRRLLSCDRDEVCGRLRPIVFAAKAKDIQINYEGLFVDLSYWGNAVKVRWAREFWGTPAVEEIPIKSVEEVIQ